MWKTLLSLTFVCMACASLSPREPASNAKKAAVLIVLDGVGYELLNRIDPDFVTQNKVRRLTPTFPSNSMPSQITISTGVSPQQHGIADNNFYIIGEKGPTLVKMPKGNEHLLVKPLWVSAVNEGTEVYTSNVLASEPWPGAPHRYMQAYDFSDLAGQFKEIVSLTKSWKRDRNLLFVIWNYALDKQGHTAFDREITRERWAEIKNDILNFKSEIEKMQADGLPVEAVFVSDHGMDEVRKMVKIKNVLQDTGYSSVLYTVSSGILHIYGHSPETSEIDDKVSVYLKEKGVNIRWYPPDSPRSGMIGELENHAVFSEAGLERGEVVQVLDKIRGSHGWNPASNPAMDGIFWRFGDATSTLPPPAHVIDVRNYIEYLLE